ncbi:CDP-alcohol phosphatidyltransferase family protein [Anaerosacchariphilus polymeriproducens]|uniref:CDP-alcohol phosphatidyltransferase family protein n=1 Tax=Anaerosacchariphilus polymeriproducens TaxID=1812858 RepID=UPI00138FECE5|nr:CDP-alcohol phosphatidyltransferase family protein [Anaerosacchariphilus polymeriproducens]
MQGKNLANILTFSRIVSACLLLFTPPLSILFYVIYTYCGVTDLVDGSVARKMNAESKTGALIDSIADLIFIIVAGIKIAPILIDKIPVWGQIAIIGIVVIRITAYTVGAIKFRRFASLHIISNKVTGGILFLIPYGIIVVRIPIVCAIVCIVAAVSAVEELVCEIRLEDYRPDIKTVFEIKSMR